MPAEGDEALSPENEVDLLTIVRNQLVLSEKQNKNIGQLQEALADFAVALRTKPSRKETFGLVGVLISAVLIVNLVMFGFVYSVASDARSASRDGRVTAALAADCLTRDGQCATMNRQIASANRVIISLRTERERLTSEIAASDSSGGPERRAILEKRLVEINEQIKQEEAAAANSVM